ncbi:MAG: 1-acyl-sn-glycerol-3-phosphate acyltransferase [Propionibacteriaceae bacterium]|nr:1-acyl-sn-glycerol-3-phosphate acyltransferase [Propionibacteriaceae bacterium]
MLYAFIRRFIAGPLVRRVWRVRLVGDVSALKQGPAVLASNHHGIAETIMLAVLAPRHLTFAAKIELFQGRSLWGRFGAWFLRAIGQAPMDRSGGQASANGLGAVETVLGAGGLVAIFPEGKRSPDGRLYRGHSGVARLALSEAVPVVPVGCRGTDFRAAGWFRSVRRRAPEIAVGPPISFPAALRQAYLDAPDRQAAHAVLRGATDQVMAAIQSLTGQEYVNAYSAQAKALGPVG